MSQHEFMGQLTVDADSGPVDQHALVIQSLVGLTWAAGRQLGLWTKGAEGTLELSRWILEVLVKTCLYRSRGLKWHLQGGRQPPMDFFGVPAYLVLPDGTELPLETEEKHEIAFKHSAQGAVLYAPRRVATRHLLLMMLVVYLGSKRFRLDLGRRQVRETGRALLHGLVLTKMYDLGARLLRVLLEEIEREQAKSPPLVSLALLRTATEKR